MKSALYYRFAAKLQILSANQKKLGSLRIFVSLKKVHPSNGDDHPAKNKMEVSAAINIILAYSARKNTAKATPEYST